MSTVNSNAGDAGDNAGEDNAGEDNAGDYLGWLTDLCEFEYLFYMRTGQDRPLPELTQPLCKTNPCANPHIYTNATPEPMIQFQTILDL